MSDDNEDADTDAEEDEGDDDMRLLFRIFFD